MAVITRFAPSPTGLLHPGNARTALFCWLFARHADGQFILRLDDTDTARASDTYARTICEDMAWLGLTHDIFIRQSDRFAKYQAAFDELCRLGQIYPCYETPEELAIRRKRQLARGRPPVYDRAALTLTDDEKAAFADEGRKPHWRFKLSGQVVMWHDLIRGEQKIDTASLSDPVLRRADGSFLYTLPSVVDDLDCHVSHVIRGEDHVTNTATQIELAATLGGKPPAFAHHSLLVMADGTALSKRLDSLSLSALRDEDIDPMVIISLLARLGTSDPVMLYDARDALIADFDLARLSRAPARLDKDDFHRLNSKHLHGLAYENVAARLAELGVEGGADFWLAVRGNLEKIADAALFWQMVAGPMTPQMDKDDADYMAKAQTLLPPEPWDETTWGQWTDALKKATGRSGKALFMPLRKALTGQAHGPEMQNLLLLIGATRARKRLDSLLS